MFVAFEAAEPRFSGILGNILNILTKPKPRLEARRARGAAYGVITAVKPVRAADWRHVTELAGRYADRMLFSEELSPPSPIKAAVCPRYERRVLLETAMEIIRLTRMPMYRRVVGLVDGSGEYADFLFPLLHHYTTVKVLTGKLSLYETQAERMMEELGAPVIICEDYSALSDCVLIIAPAGVDTSDRLACPVLTREPPETGQYSDFITGLQVLPDPDIELLCPHGIEPHKFLGALYEFCGVEQSGFSAGQMMWQYRKCGINEIVRAVSGGVL